MGAALLLAVVSTVSAAEMKLAGLTLGRPALTVMQKYGDPTEVKIGNATTEQPQKSTTPTPEATNKPGLPGMPGMTGLPGMPGQPSNMPGKGTTSTGLPAPRPTSATGLPGSSSQKADSGQSKDVPADVTWVYKFPKNKRLEVIINPDGVIVQIAVYGITWTGVKTSKGIHLGSTYKDVITKYGYPDSQDIIDKVLLAKYPKKQRAVFSFVNKKCVGMAIAL